MLNRATVLAIAVLALTGASVCHAQPTGQWTTVAAACVPDEEATGRYALEFARFEFRPGATGSIDARCNITNPDDDGPNPMWRRMEVTLNDPDGAGNNAQVVVFIRRVNKVSGATADVHVFNSNMFAAGQGLRTVAFAHAWDFVNNAYNIAISVRRANTTLTPAIQRIRLFP